MENNEENKENLLKNIEFGGTFHEKDSHDLNDIVSFSYQFVDVQFNACITYQ